MYQRAFKVCFLHRGKLYSELAAHPRNPLKAGEWMAAPRDGYWVAVKTLRQARYWLHELLPNAYKIRVPVPKVYISNTESSPPWKTDLRYVTYRPLIVEVESPKPWTTVGALFDRTVSDGELMWAKRLESLAVFASIMRVKRFAEIA